MKKQDKKEYCHLEAKSKKSLIHEQSLRFLDKVQVGNNKFKRNKGFVIFNPGDTLAERMKLAKLNCKYNKHKKNIENSLDSDYILDLTTPIGRKLYNLAREVLVEIHRSRMFTRLSISKEGILYSFIEPEHDVCYFTCNHFLVRFPKFIILIGCLGGTYIGKYDQNKKSITYTSEKIECVLEKFQSELDDDKILSDLCDDEIDQLWDCFYQSHYIDERKNIRYFRQNVSKKAINNYNMTVENRLLNKKQKEINDFFDIKK